MVELNSSPLTITMPSDLEIVMTRVFDAPRHHVFDASTKPERLTRWFGPRDWTMPVCEIDLRPGGAWRFFMRKDDGSEMGMHGVYREVAPPERLVTTEIFDGDNFEEMGSGTLNTLIFEERDGKTTMTATVLYKSREDRDAVIQAPMEQGAAESFDRLAELLETLTAKCWSKHTS